MFIIETMNISEIDRRRNSKEEEKIVGGKPILNFELSRVASCVYVLGCHRLSSPEARLLRWRLACRMFRKECSWDQSCVREGRKPD